MKHRLRDTLYGDIVFGAILLVFVALMMLAFWLGEP